MEEEPLVWKSSVDSLYADRSLLSRTGPRVIVAALVCLALTTLAFAIATFVLAAELASDNSSSPTPCPVRLSFHFLS